MTRVLLYAPQDVVLLEVVRPSVDWQAVRTARAGRCSRLTAREPVAPGGDRVFLTEVARMARVGRAAVVNWRRRNDDFPRPGGWHGRPPHGAGGQYSATSRSRPGDE
ncbi:hypothetical protein [Streptomyces lavendulae]|uniref:hypothetical protein n=1 Tax=Streptomyces lavendulae TaxID=1914 RepID=UPI0031ECFD50